MKKLLLSALVLLPLLILVVPRAHAQSYTYDCLCLFSEPGGTCVEYTCNAFRNRNTYYGNQYYGNQNCDDRYTSNCSSSYYRSNTYYQPRYRTSNDNNYNDYYDTRYNSDWYSRRYTNRSNYYNNNDNSYYNTPYYY